MRRTVSLPPEALAALRQRSTASAHERINALEQALFQLALRLADLERGQRRGHAAPPRPRESPRVSLARAGRMLGVSRDHALSLGRRGLLDLADMREEGARKPLWTVSLERVEALLAARSSRPACPAEPNGSKDSARGGSRRTTS